MTIILLVLTINIVSSQTICDCPSVYETVCCNDIDYSNTCFAECNGCTDDQISDGPCNNQTIPGEVCGVAGTNCPKFRCACEICPDGVNTFWCCDCVWDANGECQSFSQCPTCDDITCNSGKFCIFDDINGPRGVGKCKCNNDNDCDHKDGFECIEGFCLRKGQTCGGFVGIALCIDPEICITSPIGGIGTNTQPVGNCYTLQETCDNNNNTIPGDVCGIAGIDCIKYRCGCYTCPDCINEYGCCSDCVYNNYGNCQNIKKCPKIKNNYSNIKNNCICTTEYAPVCCNDYTYSNSCRAKCAGCTDDQISDGVCI